MINKPFRFLKDIMRFYSKEADNVLRQVSELNITSELWDKAAENFNKRGLHIPMYENHNENVVVGRVNKIEAREDGLYVTEHELNEKGQELVQKGIYDLPSGDFVIHYDKNGNVIDLEVFGVSIVNSEGAKDIQMITMSKDNQKIALDKIIKRQNKNTEEIKKMDNEQVLEILLDEEFLKTIPEDILKKIVEVRKEEIAKLTESGAQEADKNEGAGGNETSQPVSAEDPDASGEEKKEAKKEEAKKEEETEQKKACMSKLHDAIAEKSYVENIIAVPSSLLQAEKFVSKNHKDIPSAKLTELALDMVSFYGNGKTEAVKMSKQKDATLDEILIGMSKGGR